LVGPHDDVDQVRSRCLQVGDLLPRHGARDVEHHRDLDALAAVSTHCQLRPGNWLLSCGDQRQLVNVGELQEGRLYVPVPFAITDMPSLPMTKATESLITGRRLAMF
jgi:hypothetical protein